MHLEAMNYLSRVVPKVDGVNKIVMEIGSYNVNGSVRDLFTLARWYDGVDIRPGPGVDIIMDGHDVTPSSTYDVIVTTETLEHDPRPQHLIEVAWGALAPGGYLILTAASTGRHAHSVNGDQQFAEGEHYANIDPDLLRGWLEKWEEVEIEYNPWPGDVYAMARKPTNGT